MNLEGLLFAGGILMEGVNSVTYSVNYAINKTRDFLGVMSYCLLYPFD